MKRIVPFLLCMLSMHYATANNITVQKVTIVDTNKTAKTANIRFSISWDHSWRDSINWDAAWIFVKFREPKDSIWHYRHMTLSPSGNITGTGSTAMKFSIPADNKGAFYYRQDIGSGSIQMDSVKLVWNYGADSVTTIESVEIKVFATEMVYVPAGSYCLGNGNGTSRSYNSFQLKNAINNYVVITDRWSPLVNTSQNCVGCTSDFDDNTLYNDGIRISGLNGIDINNDGVTDFPDFPTGYRSFYCMKYPVTQGQYADFLNTLTLTTTSATNYKTALQNLDPIYNNIPLDLQRYTIRYDTAQKKYTVSRPDRALGKSLYYGNNRYNTLNSQDWINGFGNYQNTFICFSDWAGLRPLSELEYEKACRGPLPATYKASSNNMNYGVDTTSNWSGFDYAWGNDTLLARSTWNSSSAFNTLIYSGIENGTESFSNYNIYKRYNDPITAGTNGSPGSTTQLFSGGDGGNGPYRVGVFANDTSSRISSGATYYGIMDMSKNVYQITISLSSALSRTFSYKNHGDGYLSKINGYPDYSQFFTSGTGTIIVIKYGEVSTRTNYGGNYIGFRSVRTAPSDN